ncbi:mucin-17-like [Belonocnema kinseyi]|uniref:mucin-17-like n=1 Tax=Belonocnema kinseyi TaxID=2817044 RepID=UPI00143D9EF8|nr:mucin-17-like [Belonocnema kinseyi]XP_033214260.1 mucin-17-like [Belonocnema kinseyi]
MKRQTRCILLVFIVCANLKATLSLPVPEDELDTSTRLLGSSVVTSVSVVTGNEKDGKRTFQSRKVVPLHELPASPAGLLRPDKFQFYTLNKDGDVVTKQMTMQEIQSLIAAGGGHFPTEIHQTQMAGEVPTGGMKVADVVQNVQNVLKGELSKPTTVMSSLPTIPGHNNDEWSSILPSILAGDMESQSINIPETEVVTELNQKLPIPEIESKPDSDPLDIKLQTEMKPLSEINNSKLNISLSTPSSPESVKTPTKEKPSTIENHSKTPVITEKVPHDSVSIGTQYEPINTYSTSQPSTVPEKQQTKPIRPSIPDSYSKIPSFSSSEKPIFHKPSKPVGLKPPQGQKPQISVRPDQGTYEDRPIVSVGSEKLKKPTSKPFFSKPLSSKPSSPSYILLPEKQSQGVKATSKKPTFESSSKPSYSFRPEYPPVSYSEIPMIPVQVITADQILTSTLQYQNDNIPVFQVLNTISAEAVNSSKIDLKDEILGIDKNPSKYPHPVYKPDKIKVPQKTNSSSQEVKAPLPEILFSDTSVYNKIPEFITSSKTETPDTVSVISETHSTSIKIPGHPEIQIPSRFSEKPVTTPKPEPKPTISMQTVNYASEASIVYKPSDKLSGDKSSSDKPLLSEIPSKETTVPLTSPTKETTAIFKTETTTEFAKESVTDISKLTTDPISKITQAPEISETSTLKFNKESETTTEYVSEASTIPVLEMEFQKMSDISAHQQVISPEILAIEKIIETLHHPTETKFETSTTDMDSSATDFGTESEFLTTFTIMGDETSTADYTTFVTSRTTEIKSETTEEITSSTSAVKTSTSSAILSLENATDETPNSYEPLSTDLADSLSMMISQISETMPSFLPESERPSLTEVPLKGAENYKSTTISEDKFSTFSTYELNTESTRVTQGFPNFETTMYKNVDVDIGATVRLEDATETVKDAEVSSGLKPEAEASTSTTSKSDLVFNILSNSPSSTQSSANPFSTTQSRTTPSVTIPPVTTPSSTTSPLTTASLTTASSTIASSTTASSTTASSTTASLTTASSSTASSTTLSSTTPSRTTSSSTTLASTTASSTTASSTTASSTTPSSTTVSFTTQSSTTPFSTTASSTTQSSTTLSSTTPYSVSSASPSATISSTMTENAEILESSSDAITNQTTKIEESALDQIPQSDESQKLPPVNVTETPVIRVAVTESGSTNTSQTDGTNENTESPFIRIQMSDAVSIINNLLESASAQTTTSYVTLNLPEEATNHPNIIGSGLIAGFPVGNETVFGSTKTPVATDSLNYSNAYPTTPKTLEFTAAVKNKTKGTEDQPKLTVDKIEGPEESEVKLDETGDKTEKTTDKLKVAEDKTELTTEKPKDTEANVTTENSKDTEDETNMTTENSRDTEEIVKVTREKSKDTEDQVKLTTNNTKVVEDNTQVPAEKTKNTEEIENSTQAEKELSTTEKDSLFLQTNVDKIENITKQVEESQTPSRESGSTSIEIKNDAGESITSSPVSEVKFEEKLNNTLEVSTQVENIITSIHKNQTKASNVSEPVDQSAIESLAIQKENITEVENNTDVPTLLTSLVTEINETEASASEHLETIITTTPKSNKETVTTRKSTEDTVTTTKPTEETVVTNPESKTTTQEPSKLVLPSTNKTRKPETPVVRIDLSPETNSPELSEKIQLTELPIFEKVAMINPDTPVAVNSTDLTNGIISSDNNKQNPDSNISKLSEVDTKVNSNSDEDKKVELVAMVTDVDQGHKNTSNVEGQEVRIRVNDTAVLVSKIPSISANQTKLSLDKEDGDRKTPLAPLVPITPSVPLKEEVKQKEEKVQFIPLEPAKNTSHDLPKEDEKKPIVSSLDEKDKPKIDTKLIINTTKILESEKIVNDVPTGFKPINTIPVIKPSVETENVEENKENAYNKLGEVPGSVSLAEGGNNKLSSLFPKKNFTSPTSAKPGLQGPPAQRPFAKPTRPPVGLGGAKTPVGLNGAKPSSGPNSSKPNLPNKHRPGFHETNSQKPTESMKKPEGSLNLDEKWALIPQTNTASASKNPKPTASTNSVVMKESPRPQAQQPQVALDASQSVIGLDGSIANLSPDIVYFSNLCNELAFSFWSAANKGLSTSRSLALSPFGMTSMLAMVFLGARGPTSDEMNDLLRLDDVSTFNPHLVFQNVTDTVSLARRQGIANAAFVRELFADRIKVGKVMPFYKEQAQQFYEGFVEEVNFAAISDILRRRTNLLIRKQTGGRIRDFVRMNSVPLRAPLAALSANVFQTECNCSAASSEGRDGELYFAVSPAVRQRKLIPVPATVWKSGVLAGYEPSLDATVIALGGMEKLVSTIFVVPGQQGHMAPGDNLDNLEVRLVKGALHDGSWEKLLKVLIPRTSLELQVPKFSHRSIVNATAALKRMGLAELFTKHADLKGINGVGHDLHLADVLQMNLFSTCGDENISSGRHHVEIYPGPPSRLSRIMSNFDEQPDDMADGEFYPESENQFTSTLSADDDSLSQERRSSRQTEIPEKPRLKLDRPFLYFVRHNPTGLILHMGRFNPRLLP